MTLGNVLLLNSFKTLWKMVKYVILKYNQPIIYPVDDFCYTSLK